MPKKAVVDQYAAIGDTIFVLLFIYFWWQKYENPDLRIQDLYSFSTDLLINVLVYSCMVWGFIYVVLLIYSFLTPSIVNTQLSDLGYNREQYLPTYLFYIIKFFFYCLFSAYVCRVVTNAYIGYFVDLERVEEDDGFRFVVTKVIMISNLIFFFFIFYFIKPEIRDV